MENDPFLMGRGLHVDDSTTIMITEIDNIEDEQEQVKVSGPFRLVGYLRKLIHQTLVQYIAVLDSPHSPQEKPIIVKIAERVADESDGPDGGSDLDQSTSNRESLGKYNDLWFHNFYAKTHYNLRVPFQKPHQRVNYSIDL